MTDKQRLWTKIGASAVTVLAIAGLFVHGHSEENTTNAKAKRVFEHVSVERSLYNKKDVKVHDQLFGHAMNSKDPIISSVAQNHYDNTVYYDRLLHFFNVYYNWNSLKSYQDRPKELRNYATNDVLKNKKIFGNGKDKTGGDYIDNAQLNSQFNNLDVYAISNKGGKITLLADVQYNAWHSDTDDQGTGEKVFEMIYDTKSKKITSINPLFTNPNKNSDDSSSSTNND